MWEADDLSKDDVSKPRIDLRVKSCSIEEVGEVGWYWRSNSRVS